MPMFLSPVLRQIALLALSATAVAACNTAPEPATDRDTTAVIEIDARAGLRPIGALVTGVNTLAWDPGLDRPARLVQVLAIGAGSLRYPGGSESDRYHWADNRDALGGWLLPSGTATFARLNEHAGARAFITVNYGSGTPEEAAAWVAWANGKPASDQRLGIDDDGRDWGTVGQWATLRSARPLAVDDGLNALRADHPASYEWRSFEIGNEVYGDWETDRHGVAGSHRAGRAHDPRTYAFEAARFIRQMRAVDPDIQIGVVVTGDAQRRRHDDDVCYAVCDDRLAVANRLGERHSGWTAVLLHQLALTGQKPDFLIHHFYPQQPGEEDDAALLASSAAWPVIAARLRRQLRDYWTVGGSDDIGLAASEINSVASRPGKQSAGLVNALFYADSLGRLLEAGFAAAHWWCLTGAANSDGNRSPHLHGTATFGTYALVSDGLSPPGATVPPADDLLPTGHVARQLEPWHRAGSMLLATRSDQPLLSAYASRQRDGSVSLLVINKSPDRRFTAQWLLKGLPSETAAIRISTYGLREEALQQGPSEAAADVQGSGLAISFPPYSSSLVTFGKRRTIAGQ